MGHDSDHFISVCCYYCCCTLILLLTDLPCLFVVTDAIVVYVSHTTFYGGCMASLFFSLSLWLHYHWNWRRDSYDNAFVLCLAVIVDVCIRFMSDFVSFRFCIRIKSAFWLNCYTVIPYTALGNDSDWILFL